MSFSYQHESLTFPRVLRRMRMMAIPISINLTTQFFFFLLILASFISTVSMYEPGCSKPLGLMTNEIEDWQLSASSVIEGDPSCQVKYARLHQPGSRAWCANSTQNQGGDGGNPWLLVDLGVSTIVSGILLQGRGDAMEWVTSFSLATSEDAYKWGFVLDVYGKKKTFRGNTNSHHIRSIWLDTPVTARFVRIHVLEWHKNPSLRLEILGCQECAAVISGPGIGSGLTASTFASWHKKNSCQPHDGHIDSHRAWCARHNNAHQWFQFELGAPTTITGVVTKGRGDTGRRHWVTSYALSFSNDSALWYYYKETNHLTPKIFGGNMDKNTERKHYFNNPFVARFVRVHPKTWHNHIAIRGAVLGCVPRVCPPNGFRLNEVAPCVQNLAYKKEVWSNDKRHFWKDWKYGHASLAVDGNDDIVLPKCAILDNYYAEHPVWMVDLGEKTHVSGVVILTWQGDGQDKVTSYRDYVFNLERLTVYVSNKPRLDSPDIEKEPKCGSISRVNSALFHPKLHFECPLSENGGGLGMKGRYVYVQSMPVTNRWDRLFNTIFCEIYVY